MAREKLYRMEREKLYKNMSVEFFKNEFIPAFANFADKEIWAKAFNKGMEDAFELVKEKTNAFMEKGGEFTDNDIEIALAACELLKILKRLKNDK